MKPLILALAALGAQAQDLTALLSRLSEEAEIYRRAAPQALSEETLEQRAAVPGPRPGAWRLQSRQIVSEYSIGVLKEAPDTLHEFRQVVSVDGHPIRATDQARHALSLGMKSGDDRLRKRMLEDFQSYGLAGAAVDFGPLILLFSKRQAGNFKFQPVGLSRVGADEVYVLAYRQAAGESNLTVFSGRKTVRQALEGRVYLRKPDGLPLRITLQAERRDHGHKLAEEGTVDYVMTPHGHLAPAAVLHRTLADGRIQAEDRFRYAEFRRFGAESDIKFTEVPECK